MLIAKTNGTPLEPFDIVSDPRSVTALCLMYSSMVSRLFDGYAWLQKHTTDRVVPAMASNPIAAASTRYAGFFGITSRLNKASAQTTLISSQFTPANRPKYTYISSYDPGNRRSFRQHFGLHADACYYSTRDPPHRYTLRRNPLAHADTSCTLSARPASSRC